MQSGVRRLVVAGGETSGAVVDRLRIEGDSARPVDRPFGWGMSPSPVPAREKT